MCGRGWAVVSIDYEAVDELMESGWTPAVHELKTDYKVFEAVANRMKTYEIRFNDRNYQVGHVLVLKETKYTGEEMKQGLPLVYSGREIEAVVTHVLNGPIYGLMDGWAILSIYIDSDGGTP